MVTKKRVLITAGPTWVAIDRVRVISNIASGETGFILAEKLKKFGAKVTLLLGPGYFRGPEKGIRILRFKYYGELEQLLRRELKKYRYSAVIHTAAVSDFKPQKIIRGKISSNLKKLRINLVPAKKLINNIKSGVDLFKVGFKFEPVTKKNKLMECAKGLLKEANLDLVVANSDINNVYRAYILNKTANFGPFLSKSKMADCLSKLIKENLS